MMGGKLLPRHSPGEYHMLIDTEAICQRPQGFRVRTAAHDHQRGTVHAFPDRGQRLDQHVLSLARNETGHAYDGRPVAEPVALSQLFTCRRIGAKPIGIDT
ncbi:Uncharacterised protein [Mycobacteroides abscessus subsp. abscessus]|nr:Uncharacterised protein [Mycobacteroides abscessus subsp. abscessus]